MEGEVELNKDNPTHVNVLIATPGALLHSGYVKSLLDTGNTLNKLGISWAFLNEGSSHVASARESTLNSGDEQEVFNSKPVKGFFTYNKIMWIDSDITWTPEDFMKLYLSDKDVIVGAYLLTNGDVPAYRKILKEPLKFDEVKNATELIQLEAAGMGFMCVKQGVFESLSRPWFQSAFGSVFVGDKLFEFNIIGEDISVCKRITDKGFEIWLDPTIRLVHTKQMRLTWEGPTP